MIVADTSALLALVHADDPHHAALRSLWDASPNAWVIPWAVLPEVDYLLRSRLGPATARLFLADVAEGLFAVEHSTPPDLARAAALDAQHADLGLGVVDGLVVAIAERVRAEAIATLDVRHFGALDLDFKLYPRDL